MADKLTPTPEDAFGIHGIERDIRATRAALASCQTMEKLLVQMKEMAAGAVAAPEDEREQVRVQFNAMARLVGDLSRQTGHDDGVNAAAGALAALARADGAAPADLAQAVDDAIARVQAGARTLATQAQHLQARLNAVGGAHPADTDTITPAELTEEGAKLLALQTRQQVGDQSLSFAGHREQSVLSLFR